MSLQSPQQRQQIPEGAACTLVTPRREEWSVGSCALQGKALQHAVPLVGVLMNDGEDWGLHSYLIIYCQ